MVRKSGAEIIRPVYREKLMKNQHPAEYDLKTSIRTIPDYPKPGYVPRHHHVLGDARALPAPSTSGCSRGPEMKMTRSPASRRGFHSGRRGRASGLGRIHSDPQERHSAANAGSIAYSLGIRSDEMEMHEDASGAGARVT